MSLNEINPNKSRIQLIARDHDDRRLGTCSISRCQCGGREHQHHLLNLDLPEPGYYTLAVRLMERRRSNRTRRLVLSFAERQSIPRYEPTLGLEPSWIGSKIPLLNCRN